MSLVQWVYQVCVDHIYVVVLVVLGNSTTNKRVVLFFLPAVEFLMLCYLLRGQNDHMKIGFAVISCTAASLRASIPWSKLEKEPTKFELVGLQLICIPLLPSNAIRMHGVGTEKDPKCTLRTRVKRSTIARFERNYYSWRIPGEGPPRPNLNEDRNNSSNDRRRRSNRRRNNGSAGDTGSVYSRRSSSVINQNNSNGDDDKSFFTLSSHINNNGPPDEGDIRDDMSEITSHTLNEVSAEKEKEMDHESQHAAWRQKFAQKISRNIEIGIRDLHIRCEVGQGSLNTNRNGMKEMQQQTKNSESLFSQKEDESAFAFGFNIDSLVLRSANSNWETGRNVDFEEKKNTFKDTISVSGRENVIQDTKYKIFFVKNIAMYWDDSPPLILTECPLIQNNDEGGGSDAHRIWSVVRVAMEKMKKYQSPGEDVINILMDKKPAKRRGKGRTSSANPTENARNKPDIDHSYVISPTILEIRLMLHNLEDVAHSHCQAEIMPCEIGFNFGPKQMHQYRLLQYAMAAQQRLDTMIQQRPTDPPTENPRAWWRYVISCVTTRPRVRPWRDVVKIVNKRSRYVELVEKKHLKRDSGDLTPEESAELLSLEDMLPIETLLSFHLLALRNVQDIKNYEKAKKSKRADGGTVSSNSEAPNRQMSPSRRRRRPSTSTRKSRKEYGDENDAITSTDFGSPPRSSQHLSNANPNHGPVGKLPSFITADSTKNRDDTADVVRTPTKSPLPKDPGRGRRSQKRKGTLSPLSIQNRSTPNRRIDDEISFADSFASVELDNLVNGLDTASKKLEFSLDDMSVPGLDRDEEEVEDIRMVKTIRCHDLSIVVRIMDKRNVKTILKGNLKASTWIRQVPGDGVNLLFDLKNLRFIDCTSQHSSKLLSFEMPDSTPDNPHSFGAGIMVPLGISNSSDDDVFLENFCNEMKDGELALPPIGFVSRLLVSERPNGRSISLSAHAATMVWNRKCVDSFMSTFFPSAALESRTILQNQLRNAATPVVHRAQVALTSPKSMSVNVNIEAPKVWFPVSQHNSDGALYVDIGKLTLVLKKPEFLANSHWSMDCKGILAKFRRNATNVFFHNYTRRPELLDDIQGDIPIILPFDLHYEVERSGDGPAKIMQRDGVKYGRSKVATMKFSKICVKLVDVEVLAKAIGKWYGTQLRQVKRKQSAKKNTNGGNNEGTVSTSNHNIKDQNTTQISQDLTVFVEKVELYLQGKSSSTQSKSLKQNKRTYLVEVANINLSQSKSVCLQTTTGKLDFIYIGQMMKDKKTSDRNFKPSLEPRHTILRCTPRHLSSPTKSKGNNMEQGAIYSKFIHNEVTHVDDLDVTFMHIETRVTSIALKDCYAAINRILESIRIMTGEMERRVHEIGRSSRSDSQGKCIILDKIQFIFLNRYLTTSFSINK